MHLTIKVIVSYFLQGFGIDWCHLNLELKSNHSKNSFNGYSGTTQSVVTLIDFFALLMLLSRS